MPSFCVNCGATIATSVSGGQCPKCLLRLAWSAPPEFQSEGQEASPLIFGDYELGSEIARGGMGVVYRARQISLNRVVALKMIARGEFASPVLVQRFQIEAGAAARLDHPHIVPIYEIGEHRGQIYYSMKLVEGGSLAARIANGKSQLSGHEVAQLLLQIAEAIHYAHQHGVLHRDLKPSNILLEADGSPRVTDFGLAKVLEDESGLTLSTAALGTPAYMAPEQAAGQSRQVSTAADIYSLGAILYELLTGRPPFQAESALATMRRVIEEEPDRPRSLNPAIAADLETICRKCLEKEPPKRYASAEQLAADFARFLKDEPIRARPASRVEHAWRWCRRKPALAGFVAATALLLLAIFIGSPLALYRINQALRAEQVQLKRAEAGELKARQVAYASDMNLAHQAVQEDDSYRALQLLDRHRPDRESKIDLRGWEWRYFWRQCQGEERSILGRHPNGATAVGMLADGKTVFSAGRDKLVRLWDLESWRQIGLLPHSEKVTGAAASPDGRWLATASEKAGEGQPVLLWDLATQKIAASLTTEFWLRPGSITFSPDSQRLAFVSHFGGVRLWDVKARSEMTNLPAFDGSGGRVGLAFSPDSRTLAYNEDEHGAILLWDTASRSVARLAGHRDVVRSLAFSPDGQTLASGSQDRTVRLWNLAERRERFGFTNYTGGVGSVAFSPDARTLAMSGGHGAGGVIRLVDVQTGTQTAELRGPLEEISGLAFPLDGQTLLSASDDGAIRVWDLVPRAKEELVHSFAQNSISLTWRSYGPALCLSPDARHLLSVYTNQTFSVWDTLRLVEGERHTLPFTNTTMAAVAPGGRRAAFASRHGQVMLWEVETGQARFFAQPDTNNIHRLVFSPDGRYLATADNTRALAPMGGSNPASIVRVWDVDARKEMHAFSIEHEFPILLTFSADARALMAGFWKGSVKLWKLDEPGGATIFPGDSGGVGGLALLPTSMAEADHPAKGKTTPAQRRPDGQTLISAGYDIRSWDVQTRRQTDAIRPRAGVHRMALSPDGRRLAASSSDGRITIWDVVSHQEVATLEGHKEPVNQLAFTPDGDHLVSVSKDQLRVWRAASPAEVDATSEEAGK